MLNIIFHSLLIFFLRVTDVSLGTVRVIMVTRGRRLWAALLGFVEITIWVVAISKVLGHLTHIGYVLGYSGGFATGTLVGMCIVDKLSLVYSGIQIISTKKGQEIAHAVRVRGYGATLTHAEGQSGSVSLVNITVTKKRLDDVLGIVRELDPKAFVTINETPYVWGGYQRLSK